MKWNIGYAVANMKAIMLAAALIPAKTLVSNNLDLKSKNCKQQAKTTVKY